MIDSSIPLQYRGLQLNDPLEAQGRVMSLRQMGMQNQMMGAQMQALQQQTAISNLRRMAMSESQGDPAKYRALLVNNGDYEGATALDKQELDKSKALAGIESDKAGTQEKLGKIRSQAAIVGFMGGTMDHARMSAQMLRQSGDVAGADHLEGLINQHPDATPEQIRSVFKPFVSTQLNPDKLLMPNYDKFGGTAKDINPFTKAPDIAVTQTPDSIASNATAIRGQNMVDKRAKEKNAIDEKQAGIVGGKQVFDAENKLADDHKAESKTFVDLRDGYTRIKASLGNATKSAAATLAGATSFMKLLDPGSVVRESELGMALAASGVLDRATNYYNTLLRGKVLTQSQAADFQKIADQIYKAAEANQKTLDSQYTERAASYGLNPKNVIKDYTVKTDSPASAPKKGEVVDGYLFNGGDPSVQSNWKKVK